MILWFYDYEKSVGQFSYVYFTKYKLERRQNEECYIQCWLGFISLPHFCDLRLWGGNVQRAAKCSLHRELLLKRWSRYMSPITESLAAVFWMGNVICMFGFCLFEESFIKPWKGQELLSV